MGGRGDWEGRAMIPYLLQIMKKENGSDEKIADSCHVSCMC